MANSHMTFGVDLLPRTTNTYSLGNSSQKWKIYVNSINDVSDLHFTDTTYTFDGTYNASTNKAATVSTVTNAINNLGSVIVSASEPTEADLWIDTSSSPLLDYIYPVGSIYMNTTLVNPAILFGGTWARIEDTFLLAAGSSYVGGTTGGNAAHTLTVEEMPSHRHDWKGFKTASLSGSTYTVALIGSDSYTGTGGPQAAGGDSAGNTVPFNIVPPYLVVYVWQRTA